MKSIVVAQFIEHQPDKSGNYKNEKYLRTGFG